MDEGKAEPGGHHQERGANEQHPPPEAIGHQTDEEGQCRGAEEGRGRDGANLKPVESQSREMERQEHTDEAIAERTYRAGTQQHPSIGRCLRWQERPVTA